MTKANQAVLHMTVLDDEYQPDATIMRGDPRNMLALICMALHMYMNGSSLRWKLTARKVVREVLNEEIPDDSSPRNNRIIGALLFVAGIFSLFGVICFVSMVMAKLTGRM